MPYITNDGKSLNKNYMWLQTKATKEGFYRKIMNREDDYLAIMRADEESVGRTSDHYNQGRLWAVN